MKVSEASQVETQAVNAGLEMVPPMGILSIMSFLVASGSPQTTSSSADFGAASAMSTVEDALVPVVVLRSSHRRSPS